MRPCVRTYLVDDDGNRVFGPGPAELLRRVREHGSLRAASISMDMAYTKALTLVRNAERGLGAPLTRRAVGGVGGGGSTPTPEADALLAAYERWTAAVESTASAQFAAAFAKGSAPVGDTGGQQAASGRPVASRAAAGPGASEDEVVELAEPRRVGVAVMAAGHAVRFGSNKLVAPLLGEPVLARTLAAVPAGLPMVVASNSPEVDALVDARGIDRVRPAGPGQGDSVAALAAYARRAGWDACVFMPGDQPLVEQGSVRSVLSVADARPDACVRLAWRGRLASPAVFPAALFERLEGLSGDVGGSAVLGDDTACVGVEATWPWELWDVDTPADLARVREIIEAGLGRGAAV